MIFKIKTTDNKIHKYHSIISMELEKGFIK